jgi:hypothetical protein
MNPSISCFEYTLPVWQTTRLANNTIEYTFLTFNCGFDSPADEVIRRNLELRKITGRIDRQQNSCPELGHSDLVSAPADIRYADLINET